MTRPLVRIMLYVFAWLAAGVWLIGSTGCARQPPAPELATLYNRSAMFHDADRNPVIVIPGILGSRLIDSSTGQVCWGAFDRDYADPRTPEGARLVTLPMRRGAELKDLRDSIVPDGALDRLRINLLGLPISFSAYANILSSLGVGGYRDQALSLDYGDDHYTCFQFSYDWRRDNVETAQALHQFILEKKAYVQAQIKRRHGVEKDVKFDIVAHSMGGLVARYYLMYGDADLTDQGDLPPVTFAGAKHVERIICVGTPNAGSADSIERLVHGADFAPRIIPKYEAAVLGSYPSIYQLLPRARHGSLLDEQTREPLDLLDPDLWRQWSWGLADPKQDRVLKLLFPESSPEERRAIALDHQDKCLRRARRFAEAMDRPVDLPPGVWLHLFAGDAAPTRAAVHVDQDSGKITGSAYLPGDGTVARYSALLDERAGGDWTPRARTPIDWHTVQFLFTDHLGMTADPAFTDNVLYQLLEAPRPGN